MQQAARLALLLVLVAARLSQAVRVISDLGGGALTVETSAIASLGFNNATITPAQVKAYQRILKCEKMTPWSGLKGMFEAAGQKSSLGSFIVTQVQERINTQGQVIQQGNEGFCGPVSLEYIFVLKRPDDFAEVIADLFCHGWTSMLRMSDDSPDDSPLEASQEVLKCAKSAEDENMLWGFQKQGYIHAVDWIWSAPLAQAHNWMLSVCGPGDGQGQSPGDMQRRAKTVFPEASLTLVGGLKRHIWRTVSGFGQRSRHVSREEWENVLATVAGGGQALLTVLKGGNEGRVLRSSTNHWVVLTQVIDSSFVSGSGQKFECARRLLSQTKACVVWTHAAYKLFESCDNLRKGVADVLSIDFPQGQGTPGPSTFSPRGSWNLQIVIQLTRLSTERRLGLAGLWPGSKVVAKERVPLWLRDNTYTMAAPGSVGKIIARDFSSGDISVYWEGGDFAAPWIERKDFPKLKVTSVAPGSGERVFQNNEGTFQMIGWRLMGDKQKAAGYPAENFAECPTELS